MKNKPIPTEAQEQTAFMQWLAHYPHYEKYILHIPNGEYRPKNTAAKLKKMGVKPGVSDFFIACPKKGYHGAWIEMKRRNYSNLSQPQQDWLNLMKSKNYKTGIAYGWEQARDFVLDYFN